MPVTTKMVYDITIQAINLKKNTVAKSNVIFPNLGSKNNNNTWTTIYSIKLIKHPLLFSQQEDLPKPSCGYDG